MKLLRYVLVGVFAVVVIVAIAAGVVFNRWTAGPLPATNGEITVDGLDGRVEIIRDEFGVPHVYAGTTHDLRFAQGYVHAQDRWWQMEFYRHTGDGTLQELTGKTDKLMATDIYIRSVGWRRAAERDAEALPDDVRAELEAFADGVNAYILSRSASELAFEYNVLGITGVSIEIEPWTPADTLVWAKVMAWDLSANEEEERMRSELLGELGQEMYNDFFPEFPYDEKPTIIWPDELPENGEPFATPLNDLQESAGLSGLNTLLAGNFDTSEGFAFGRGDSIGSNNWVVDGSKTDTGLPLLANDPHLGIRMPSIWYEIGLHCQPVSDDCPYNVRGFALSPSPGVVLGHNDHIGWGVTNIGWDTQDLYHITVNPDNDFQYLWDDEWHDMTVIEEVIQFGDGEDPLSITVRETHLGPIVTDNRIDKETGELLGFNNEEALALHWTALEIGTIAESIFRYNRANNWDEFRAALSLWDTPAMNFVFADTEGNIGYQTPGKIPVRAPAHTGKLPVDGSTSDLEWRGYVPYEYLPSILNPQRGHIETANQALVPLEYYTQLAETLGNQFGEDAHYVFDYQWNYGYRGQRIVELLENADQHTVDSFRSIQGDNYTISAVEMTPYLESLDFGDAQLDDMRDWMLDWDYQMDMDSPQAALYAVFWARLMESLYADQLGEIGDVHGGSMNMWATTLLAQDPDNMWWDDANTDDVRESRDEIFMRSFSEALAEIEETLGENRADWQWGDLHTTTFVSNPLGLSGIGIIEGIVNAGPVPAGGSSDVLNATGWSASSGDFTVRSLPSMRMILDLNDFSKSLTVHTTGQSGHPYSNHYADMVDDWRKVEYRPMLWTREEVEAHAEGTLILLPE